LVFLSGCSHPTLCTIEENKRGKHVKTFVIDMREKELVAGPWVQNNVESGASKLIPIPSPINGVIVVGNTTITYLTGTGNIQSLIMKRTIITAYSMIDTDASRILLGNLIDIMNLMVTVT
jgi:DNA damage-binding protein 1